ncbi:MAG: tape measure protein, partial [Polynucleobacter sp.]
MPVVVKLDNKSIAGEFRRLSKYLGQKKYRIDITDTAVKTAADKVEALSEKLKALSSKIQIEIGTGTSRDAGTAAKVMAQKLANQFKGDIDAAARAMQQMRPSSGPYGRGTMSVPGFKEAAQGMGIENAFKLFFQELKQLNPKRLATVLDDGSTMMMRENADIKAGLNAIQDKAQKLARDLSVMGDAARMSGRAFIEEGGKTLYPQNYGLKIASLISSVEKLNNDLRRVSVEGGVELLDALQDLSSTLKDASNSFVRIAGLNSTLDDTLRGFDVASKKASQATNAYADRITRRAGISAPEMGVGTTRFSGTEVTGALAKRATPYDPYEVIEVQVRNAFDIIEDFHKRRLEDFTRGFQETINSYYDNIQIQQAQIRGVSPFDIPRQQLALPPAGGTTPVRQMRFNAVSDAGGSGGGRGGGYVPPGGFPSDGPMGGKQGQATFIGAGSQMEKFKTGLDVASASMRNFRASQIPLIGGLKELGSEFGFALKQVLLFGTAYRGLAFVQSLPGQVLNAVKSQQQFNNALQTATQDTGTFAKELLYVDNVQRAFGLNLQTTRDGFTKLYASMGPSGFDSGSIEKLFTGISAATAALQLTPDKAERVIYAFGQMASKGQIMSEELKGQLGDVLPGALAIFAKSAGMSVKEFSKAMEDGEFVGNRFREVFARVSDELMNRFGTGAQAAGRSLQGLLNTLQGDFQRTLESFAPLANIAAQAILGPLSQSLNQLSKAASLAFGEQERLKKQLAEAKEIKDNAQNVAALEARLEALNAAASDPSIAQQAKNIESFVTQVSAAAKNVTNFAGAIGSVLGPILTLLGTNLNNIIGSLTLLVVGFNGAKMAAMTAMGVMTTMNAVVGMSRSGAVAVNLLAAAYRFLGVQATGAQVATMGFGLAVKGLLASTGVGLLVVLLGSVASAFLSIGDSAAKAAEKTKTAMASMQDAIRTGNVEIAKADLYNTQRQRNTVEDAIKLLDRLEQKGRKTGRGGSQVYAQTNLSERMLLEQAGFDLQGRTSVDVNQLRNQVSSLRAELKNLEQRQKVGVNLAEQQRQKLGLNKPSPTSSTTTEPETPDEKAIRAQQKALEDARKLADDKAKYEANLLKMTAMQALDLNSMEFEHWKQLQEAKYNILEAGQNSWMSREIKFQKDLQAIELKRIEGIRKAKEATAKAEIEAGAKSYIAGAGGAMGGGARGLPAGVTQYITGDPNSPFYRPDHGGGNYHEHIAFASRAAAEEAYNKLISSGVQVTEFMGKSPIGRHTPGSAHYSGLAFDVPAAQVPVGQEKALTSRVQSILGFPGAAPMATGGMPASRQRAELNKDYNAALAAQTAINAKEKENLETKHQQKLAVMELTALIKEYVASIAPVEEQKLENELLQQRINLISSGKFGEALATEEKIMEAREKAALGVQKANQVIADNNKLVEEGKITADQAAEANGIQAQKIKELETALQNYIPLLRERLSLEQDQAEASLRGDIQRATPLGGMGLAAGFIGAAADRYKEAIGGGASTSRAAELAELQNQLTLLETRNEAIQQS